MNTARVMKRVPFVKDVVINGKIKVRAIDLSQGGLYVHTGRSNLTGQIVEVSIPFGGEFIKVRAKVVHKQDAVGMGLMFIGLSFDDRRRIGQLIDEVPTVPRNPGSPARRKRKTVLLIEDNVTTQRIYKSRLVFDGFSVLTANNGLEALGILKRGRSAAVNAIILDLYMEGLDGFHFLAALKKMHGAEEIPVIVLTARITAEAVKKAMANGAVRVLQKASTSPAALASAVKDILRPGESGNKKMNCWDFRRCGRTPYDGPIDEKRICPASVEKRLDGIHGGKNAGRACWAVTGTMRGGKRQGSAYQKFRDCMKCPFYRALKREEGENYHDTLRLLCRVP